jgi:hypothetical protein
MDAALKIRQFKYENESSRRMVEFLMQENVMLKTRLAELLSEIFTAEDLLEIAEFYQASFIRKDEIINLIRQDIGRLDNMLTQFIHKKDDLDSITQAREKLNRDLKNLGVVFIDMKTRFNNDLETIL